MGRSTHVHLLATTAARRTPRRIFHAAQVVVEPTSVSAVKQHVERHLGTRTGGRHQQRCSAGVQGHAAGLKAAGRPAASFLLGSSSVHRNSSGTPSLRCPRSAPALPPGGNTGWIRASTVPRWPHPTTLPRPRLRAGIPVAQQVLMFAGCDLADDDFSWIGEGLILEDYNVRQEVSAAGQVNRQGCARTHKHLPCMCQCHPQLHHRPRSMCSSAWRSHVVFGWPAAAAAAAAALQAAEGAGHSSTWQASRRTRAFPRLWPCARVTASLKFPGHQSLQ
jgi:hypothetical protein